MAQKIMLAALLLLLLPGLSAGNAGEKERAAPVIVTSSKATLPDIHGPAPFVEAIRESLSLLFDTAPDDYAFVTEQINLIELNPVFGSSVALVNVKTRTIVFPRDWQYERYDRAVLSGILVREATHAWLYENNYLFYSPEAEKHGLEEKVHAYILLN